MIKIEKIDKYFNKFKKNKIHVINNTSLEFESNGLVALLGPSGSGKTTLLNVIGGLDKVRKGNIFINGEKITKKFQGHVDRVRNLNIGYIFQDYKLIEDMSVYDNVALVLKMIGIKDKEEIDKRITYVLEKTGMLRYKKRPCSMLSGGERQRVGIARAIVKNPSIIIADEPTGNLDSKNSVEIMNIIKAISKDKLVILVTHEVNLAKFYASRIIELEDGKIIDDYKNENEKDLDYEIGNTLYLKDYKYQENINQTKVYSNSKIDLNVSIVISNNNIYIKTNDDRKIEVIDEESSIEMIDDHFKNITKEEALKYQFDFNSIINNSKLKYSSIFNPISFITNGFKKVFNYSILKKILLGGFFLSGIFILFAFSSIAASLKIEDKNFLKINKNYLTVEAKKIRLDDYLNIENKLNADYIIPTNSIVNLKLKTDDFYQFNNYELFLEGSLTDIDFIKNDNLIIGKMPLNDNEILVDKMVIESVIKQENAQMMGLRSSKDFLDREIIIPNMDNMKIVGIINSNNPSIYTKRSKFINIIYHTLGNNNEKSTNNIENKYEDYNLFLNKVSLKEGRWPENDYEVVVNYNNHDEMKLNKEINKTINNHKLKVVGYYTSKEQIDTYLVNTNLIKIKLITSASDISIYTKNKEKVLNEAHNNFKINIKDSYLASKDEYIQSRKEGIKTTIISSGIIIIISLIEIFLMIRSSFLSRVKEVGIYRAIGVKKRDIYIMFSGEIIAITCLASIPGILFSTYVISLLTKISYLKSMLLINPIIVGYSILLVFIFNLIVGLVPIYNTLRKRPAEILSRTDI
ncbi:MAG: ABC transporter ATP-binding protein/permease [Bacilli bacterium]|nr:ABC transporter ATP-binding protein/permease [Bacilli bacterium]